jgi:hypothetical protein
MLVVQARVGGQYLRGQRIHQVLELRMRFGFDHQPENVSDTHTEASGSQIARTK